jgi:hypothetical protein
MKKTVFSIFITLFIAGTSYSQYDIRAGLGISLVSTPSLIDYLNQHFAPSNQQLGVFNTSVVFSGEGGYFVDDNHEIALEVAYQLNSYNFSYNPGEYSLSYDFIMPTFIYYYLIKGTGYNLKFGGGLGPRFTSADEKPQFSPSTKYSSIGLGFLAKADGNTLLSDKLYANIGVDLRYDFNGSPKNGSSYLVNTTNNKNVNFNSLSIGIHIGVSYIF